MRTAIRLSAVSLLLAAGARGQTLTAQTSAFAQRFQSAATYEQFTATDTARREQWRRNYQQAATPVAEIAGRVRALGGRWHLLIVAESWCNDAANSVPYLARLAAENPNVDIRMLRPIDARDLLDTHQLEGRSATPVVLLFDDGFIERGAWIERPAALRALIKSKEGRTCEDALREEVVRWRAADGGRSVLAEVLSLMERQPPSPNEAHPND